MVQHVGQFVAASCRQLDTTVSRDQVVTTWAAVTCREDSPVLKPARRKEKISVVGSTLFPFPPHIPPATSNIPIVKPPAGTNLFSDMQSCQSLPMVTPTVIASKQQGCTEHSDLTSMPPVPDYLNPLRLQPAGSSLYGVPRMTDTNHVTCELVRVLIPTRRSRGADHLCIDRIR